MRTAPKYIPHYTVDDYMLWEGDWELWSGVPVAMTPSSSGGHGSGAAQIVTSLTNAIDQAGCDASVLIEIDWLAARDSVYRPDVSVVCGGPPEGHIEEPPAIAVEVLSPSTRERDLNFKRSLYAEHGIAWYLILDPTEKTLTALRLDDAGEYAQAEFDDTLAIDICGACSLSVKVDRLFR